MENKAEKLNFEYQELQFEAMSLAEGFLINTLK